MRDSVHPDSVEVFADRAVDRGVVRFRKADGYMSTPLSGPWT